MKFNLPFTPQRTSFPGSQMSKKRFAPWETLFDEMFELWFNIDFPNSRSVVEPATGIEQ